MAKTAKSITSHPMRKKMDFNVLFTNQEFEARYGNYFIIDISFLHGNLSCSSVREEIFTQQFKTCFFVSKRFPGGKSLASCLF